MVYVQLFAGDPLQADPPLLLAPGEAARLIGNGPALVVGSGAEAVAEAVRVAGGTAEAALPDLQPHAASLALMAPALVPAKPLTPLYLRPPDVRPQDDKSLPRVAP
jgi:tRNA threonylcarbamoyladenosine biosynthesis protein TsaB